MRVPQRPAFTVTLVGQRVDMVREDRRHDRPGEVERHMGMTRTCDNCGERCDADSMVATPECQWVCPPCFAEDPEAYGFDIELDGDLL